MSNAYPKIAMTLMLALGLAAGAEAAPILSISGPTSVSQGAQDVTFKIDVSDDGGGIDIGAAQIPIAYDPAVFSFDSVAPGGLLSVPPDSLSGNDLGTSIGLSITSLFGITAAGTLAELVLDVLPDAPVDTTSLSFDTMLIFSSLGAPVPPPTAQGIDVDVTESVPAPAAWALLPLGLLAMRRRRA